MRDYYMVDCNKRNGFNLWDSAFDSLFGSRFYDEKKDMKTDIREDEKSYFLDIEVPGFDKNDIKVSLEDGYLTVSAEKQVSAENEDKNEKPAFEFLRRERKTSVSRSFYVGDVDKENIKAKYENGLLSLEILKEQPKKEEPHNITIE
jgi:HSP20 family molecular chaperone IbpA